MGKYRIPKKLRVGGFDYTVVFPYVFNENTDYLGLHDWDDLEIRVASKHHGMEVDVQRIHETMFHEMLHGVSKVYCDGEVDSEDIISTLSCGLYQVIKDNKTLTIAGKINIPKKLRIGPFDIKVSYPFGFRDTNNSCSFRTTKLEFCIDKKTQIEFALLDLLFSILYAICDNTGIENERDITHLQIQQLGNGLFQVLKDNPIEYMIRGK